MLVLNRKGKASEHHGYCECIGMFITLERVNIKQGTGFVHFLIKTNLCDFIPVHPLS